MKFNKHNVSISSKSQIGANVKIGDNTVIYDNVIIGDNSVICNDCVLGEPLNEYYHSENYTNPPLLIGANSIVRSHTILYAGSSFGTNFMTGHRVTVRENSVFGNNCSIGTVSDIQGHVTFGDYCRLHSNVHIGQKSIVGNFVFIFPYVVFTNDPHPPSTICIGPSVGDYSMIAVASILLPGVQIGTNSLVAANSVVNKNVGDFEVVAGNPAKKLCDIRDIKSKHNQESYYPWMHNFDRGMPWAEMGYAAWEKKQ